MARRRPGTEPLPRPPTYAVLESAMLALTYGVVAHLLSTPHRLQGRTSRARRATHRLLAEVHHRVKNNLPDRLQLLMLQAEKLSNAADKGCLR